MCWLITGDAEFRSEKTRMCGLSLGLKRVYPPSTGARRANFALCWICSHSQKAWLIHDSKSLAHHYFKSQFFSWTQDPQVQQCLVDCSEVHLQ